MSSIIYGASKALFIMLSISDDWEINKYRLSRRHGKVSRFSHSSLLYIYSQWAHPLSFKVTGIWKLSNLILLYLNSRLNFPGRNHPEILQRMWDILTHICWNGSLELFQSSIGLVHQDMSIFFLHDKFSQWRQWISETDCFERLYTQHKVRTVQNQFEIL